MPKLTSLSRPDTPAGYSLSPLGSITPENQQHASAYIDGLVYESAIKLQPLLPQADENLNLHLGNQWFVQAPDYYSQICINRIQNATIAQVAIQAEQTPKVKFTPRESLEPPIYFLNTKLETTPTPEVIALLAQLPPETREPWPEVETDPEGNQVTVMRPPRELLPEEVQLVEQAINLAAQNAAALGVETTIPPDILIGTTDRIAAEAVQTIYDAKWDECNGDFRLGENVLDNAIIGWQWLQYEFDDDTYNHKLRNVSFLHVHADPLATDVSDAQYVIYDQVMPADEACAAYPEIEADIRRNAAPGTVEPMGTQYRQASVFGQINFQREMITVRTAWIRNSPVPLTVQEALERGIVTEASVDVVTKVECTCGMGEDVPMPQHAQGCPCREGYEEPMGGEMPMAMEGEQENPQDGAAPVANSDDLNGQMLPPVSRTTTNVVYKLKNGDEVKPGERGWPSRPILRQIRVICDHIVDDRECEFADIPMCLNVNIPRPYSMYGQGEPERLKGLQVAINSVLSDMVTHWHFHGQPAEFVSDRVYETLPKQVAGMYMHAPGSQMIVPHDLLVQLGGKIGGFIDPPKIPSDGWQLLQLLLDLIDKESGNNEVLQGRASASWSGEAIQSLQNAAKGSIGLKSRRTEFMLKSLAKLMAHSIIHRMPLEEKMRYASKWPAQVWTVLDNKLKTLEMDVSIEITSGTGAKKQAQQATDLSLFDRGLLSKSSMLESVNRDPKVERTAQLKEAREDASVQQQMPQQPQQQAQPAQQQPPEQPAQ